MTKTTSTKNTLRVVAIAALTTLMLATMVSAQSGQREQRGDRERGFGGPGSGGDPMGRIVEFLELTPEQEELWKEAHEEHRATIEPVFEQIRDNHEALQVALEVEQPDAFAVGELVIASKQLREQIGSARLALEETLASFLDPEQLTKWEAFQEARGDRGHGRSRGFGGSGSGFPGGRG